MKASLIKLMVMVVTTAIGGQALVECPLPCTNGARGKITDFRRTVRPVGECREWLIVPSEGYAYHLEEEYRPGANGSLVCAVGCEYVANQVVLLLPAAHPYEDFKAEMERQGLVVRPPLMKLDGGGMLVAVKTVKPTLTAIDDLTAAVRSFDPELTVERDSVRRTKVQDLTKGKVK